MELLFCIMGRAEAGVLGEYGALLVRGGTRPWKNAVVRWTISRERVGGACVGVRRSLKVEVCPWPEWDPELE